MLRRVWWVCGEESVVGVWRGECGGCVARRVWWVGVEESVVGVWQGECGGCVVHRMCSGEDNPVRIIQVCMV